MYLKCTSYNPKLNDKDLKYTLVGLVCFARPQ